MPRKATKKELDKFDRFTKWLKKEGMFNKVKGKSLLLSLSMEAFEKFEESKKV